MTLLLAGRLVLLGPLGEGGTATVHRAYDVRRRRCVAAKLVPRPSYDERGTRMPVAHPHVLAVDEELTTAHLVVLLMPLARGGTADRLLAEHGALPHDFVAVVLDQLLDALAAVHRAGLVHGDVKPANLLLDATGRGRPHARLADFGAATAAGSHAWSATDAYLAPETADGAPADPRQDLFAAGVTAVELLTGSPPPRPPPRGPLRPLLAALTDPDADDRIPDAAAARRVLHALGVPDGAPWQRRPHPPYVPDRTLRRDRSQRR